MSKPTPHPPAICPQCGHALSVGNSLSQTGAQARAGDFGLCAYCGTALRYDAYHWSFVRRASGVELQSLAHHQPGDYALLQEARRRIRRRRHRGHR